jgi:hypothetical protein
MYGLRLLGIQNAALQLVSTTIVGAAVYIGLALWHKPPVVYELAALLQGSSSSKAQLVGRFLPSRGSGEAPRSQEV